MQSSDIDESEAWEHSWKELAAQREEKSSEKGGPDQGKREASLREEEGTTAAGKEAAVQQRAVRHDLWLCDSIEGGVGPNVQVSGALRVLDCLFLHHLKHSTLSNGLRVFADGGMLSLGTAPCPANAQGHNHFCRASHRPEWRRASLLFRQCAIALKQRLVVTELASASRTAAQVVCRPPYAFGAAHFTLWHIGWEILFSCASSRVLMRRPGLRDLFAAPASGLHLPDSGMLRYVMRARY